VEGGLVSHGRLNGGSAGGRRGGTMDWNGSDPNRTGSVRVGGSVRIPDHAASQFQCRRIYSRVSTAPGYATATVAPGMVARLYTVIGAVVAFLVGVLIWPVRARDRLRVEIAGFLDDLARLYSATTDAGIREKCSDTAFESLRSAVTADWDRLSTALDEARSEPAFSRFNEADYAATVEELNHLRQRLMAMCGDSDLYSHATVLEALVPELKPLTDETARSFIGLAASIRGVTGEFNKTALDETEQLLDQRLQKLREARITSPFSLDRMLPFWSFLFNLKEIVASLRAVQSNVQKLS